MTKSKYYLITLLTAILLSVVWASSSSFAQDISSTSQTEATISVPLTQWNELKKNNRESLELNRSIQYSIERSSELSHEAKDRVDRSTQYNQQIGKRIDASQASINEARSYLKRNAELFDRIERANRERTRKPLNACGCNEMYHKC